MVIEVVLMDHGVVSKTQHLNSDFSFIWAQVITYNAYARKVLLILNIYLLSH